MTTDKSIFGKKYSQPQRESIPTLFQWVKTLKKDSKELQQVFMVEIVWLPGKFDNVTLQTHKFRLILSPTHELYQQFLIAFDDLEVFGEDTKVGLRITNQETLEFEIEEMSGTKGKWTQLSSNAYKYALN